MARSLQLDLKYGSRLHDKLKNMIWDRYQASLRKMAIRHKKWIEAENLFLSYVTPTDEKLRRERRRDAGQDVFVNLTIPYSYAILLTAHTYWSSVFLSRTPIFQYTGRHGESQQNVQAVEALIDYQVSVGRMLPALFMWLLDAGKYGIGVVGNYWCEEEVQTSKIIEEPKTVFGIEIPGSKVKKRVISKIPGYYGNKIYNIRPYQFFPDPNVSISNFQSGEFCGRLAHEGLNEIIRKAAYGYYIKDNVEALRERWRHLGGDERETGSSQIDLPETNDIFSTEERHVGSIDNIEMVIELIPKEVGIGDGDLPEKWVFNLAAKEVVIGAAPLDCDHNQFPYHVLTYDIDMYSHSPRGMMEVLKPLNQTLDWLFNTHFFNVAKILNDVLVVDPQMVVMKDLLDKGAGKVIRLSPQAYGKDVRTVISQLPIADVTTNHLRDAQLVMDLMQRATGATDNLMGMVNQSGRRTATEVRTSSSFGVNRLRVFSEYNSSLGWTPLSQMLLQNSQQNYSIEQQFKIAGDLISKNPKYLMIRPEDISGFYDFVPVDGTLPIDRMAQANLWKEILLGVNQMPWLAQQYDLAGIFAWMAQIAGLKNISQFRLNIAPNQMIQQGMEQGNLIPASGGATNANGSGTQAFGNPTPI